MRVILYDPRGMMKIPEVHECDIIDNYIITGDKPNRFSKVENGIVSITMNIPKELKVICDKRLKLFGMKK